MPNATVSINRSSDLSVGQPHPASGTLERMVKRRSTSI